MAKTAIALIVAGSGEVTDKEVFDLLEDAYPMDDYEDVGLVVPLDKDLYTDAVKHAVKWFDSDKDVLTVQTNGASMSRAAAKIGDGTQKVDKFSDILNMKEFEGDEPWDEVHFLVAIPSDPDDPDYDLYAEMVEAAIDGGLVVKNLAAGLDDVELADDEPEPEPEPEPVEEAKPARRSRARKTPEPDPVVAEAVEKIADEPEEEAKPARRSRAKKDVEPEKPASDAPVASTALLQAWNSLGEVVRYLEAEDRVNALANQAEVRFRPLTKSAREAYDAVGAGTPVEDAPAAEKPAKDEDSGRGRGRPRTNFEIKQIWDEDEGDVGDWVPRPAGRLRKGTEWRTIHAETNEVLDEGTA